MRDKGLDIEDNDVTDWQKYNTDKQYRDERKVYLEQKKKDGKGGLTPNQYRKFLAQKKLNEANEILIDAKSKLGDAIKTYNDTLATQKNIKHEIDVRADALADRKAEETIQQYEREFDYRVNAKAQEITAPIQQSCECALKDYNNRIANIDNAVEEQMRLYIESQKNEDTPEMKRVKQFLASRVSSKTKKSELDVYNEYAQHHPLDRTERIRRDTQRIADAVRNTDWSASQWQLD